MFSAILTGDTTMIEALDIVAGLATIAGMVGSVAITKTSWRGVGFGVWIVGNLLWIARGIGTGDVWVTAQFLFYEGTAIIGFWGAFREVRSC